MTQARAHRRPSLSYANVMATLAMFVALGGIGYAAAKLPRDSVGAKQIKADAVRASEQAPNSVNGSNVINGSLGGDEIVPQSLGGGAIADGSLGGDEIADGSLGGDEIADSSLGGAKIASGAIATHHLADDSVTRAKMAPAELNTPTLEDCAPGTPWQPVSGLPPRYWKDNENVVHLQGAVSCSAEITGASIFQIPRFVGDSYDPVGAQEVVRFGSLGAGQSIAQIAIVQNTFTTGVLYDAGSNANTEDYVSLDGLTYLAE